MKAIAEPELDARLATDNAPGDDHSTEQSSKVTRDSSTGTIPQALPIERFGATAPFHLQAVKLHLPGKLVRLIQKWSRQAGLKPEYYLLASWQILIWHMLNRSAHVTGVILKGAEDSSISPQPIACDPEPGLSMEQFTREVQSQVEHYLPRPFETAEGDEAIFTVLFQSSNSGQAEVLAGQQGPYLLCCRCEISDGTIEIAMEFDSSRIDEREAILLARSFKQFCTEAIPAMQTPVQELTIVDHPRVPQGRTPDTHSPFIPEMFVQQSRRSPHLAAVTSGDQTLTYGELLAEANAVACFLQEHNVHHDEVVAIEAGRSVHTVTAILGVLLAGGAYAPLDPETPAAYRARQIAASGTQLVLAAGAPPENALPESVQVTGIAEILSKYAGRTPDHSRPSEPESLAYVIHTSGSTGVPKAVGVSHRALANYTQGIREQLRLKSKKSQFSFLLACSLAVDLGHTCLFPALTTGSCLHLMEKTAALDAAFFAGYMTRNHIDVLKIVPSHFRALLTHGKEVLPQRWLILGGEPFQADLYSRIRELNGPGKGCAVANHYGPTETTVGCLMNPTTSNEEILLPPIVSAGRPLPGYRCYVLDEAMRHVAVNMPGELYVGGAGVARGYLQQPAETGLRFVPDPFSSEPGQRLYRTGDLARLRKDGRIQILGRIDDQVKIRGHRVEPAEVEAIIAQHPAVSAAAVLVQAGEKGVPSLIAFVTAAGASENNQKAVESAIAAQLPPAMVPSLFVWLDAMPLLPNGKIDRKRLQVPAAARSEPLPTAEPPQTGLEKIIIGTWKEVLSCEAVGSDDNFFELGGDSIGAIRVAALLRQAGVQITPIQLFQHATPRSLAQVAVPVAGPGTYAVSEVAKTTETYPLTPVQEGLLFHCLSAPGDRLYVSESSWIFGVEFDAEAFIQAWQTIVNRHSVFRTSFQWQEREQPIQVVQPNLTLNIERQDWRACNQQQIQQRLDEYLTNIHRAGIDLDHAPLMHLALIKLPEDRHQFIFIYHHLLMDGWSEGILFDELEELYDNFHHGHMVTLPDAAPYHEFVEWLQTRDFARTDQFWREYLKGFQRGTAVPGDTNRTPSPDQVPSWDAVQAVVERASSDRLRQFALKNQITVNTLVQAAWGVVLGEFSGDGDVLFGAPVAVRPPEAPRLARTIGLFLNMTPVRVRLNSNATVVPWLQSFQQEQLTVREYSDVPLLQVHSCSAIPHGKPLFETTVGFQNLALAPSSYVEGRAPLLPIEKISFRGGWTNYALALDIEPREELLLTASFDERRLSTDVARQVLEAFQMALKLISEHESSTVSTLRDSLASWRRSQVAHKMKVSLQSHRRQSVKVS
jgi:amino acid adenylation domain-containing protein